MRPNGQLGGFRPCEDAEGNECLPEAGRHVQRGRAVLVQTLDVSRTQVREAQLASRIRDDDLAGVQVAGEDEVEHTGDALDDPGEVAEQDSERRVPVGQFLGRRPARRVRLRVDTHDLDAPAAELDVDSGVAEEHDLGQRLDRRGIDPLREGIAAVIKVVVAEDDVAAAENPEKPLEISHARAARDEVARDADEIGLALEHPVDGVEDRPPTA